MSAATLAAFAPRHRQPGHSPRTTGLALMVAVAGHAAALAWWMQQPPVEAAAPLAMGQHLAVNWVSLPTPPSPSTTPAPAQPLPRPAVPTEPVKAAAAPMQPAAAPVPAPAPVTPAPAVAATPAAATAAPPSPPLAAAPAPAPAPVPAPAVAPAASAVVPASFDAAYLDNPRPLYPAASRQEGEEGTVLLRVRVLPNGLPEQVELARSSGFDRLDKAARSTVARWRFTPARQGDQAIAAWVQVPISFALKRAQP